MKAKEAGYVLVIDQASNAAGVSLWRDGNLVATTVLASKSPTDPFSRRVQHQVPQLTDFLDQHLPAHTLIEKVLFEGVKARLVMIVVGSFLVCPRISAKMHEKFSFVGSGTWKRWARDHGATGPVREIKGKKSLTETGFDTAAIDSDDICDSILMYFAWRDYL